MFKEIFIRLCNEKGVAPTVVCKSVGLSDAAFSKWTDESVPRRATLMRIADYFGVSVDYLLGNVSLDLQHFASPSPVDEAMAKLTASIQQVTDELDKQKKPVLGLNPKLSALIDGMTEEELEDLERYAEFIKSRKKG